MYNEDLKANVIHPRTREMSKTLRQVCPCGREAGLCLSKDCWEVRVTLFISLPPWEEVTGRGCQTSPKPLPPFSESGVQMMRTACNVLVIKTESFNGPFLGSTAWDLYRLLASTGGQSILILSRSFVNQPEKEEGCWWERLWGKWEAPVRGISHRTTKACAQYVT